MNNKQLKKHVEGLLQMVGHLNKNHKELSDRVKKLEEIKSQKPKPKNETKSRITCPNPVEDSTRQNRN